MTDSEHNILNNAYETITAQLTTIDNLILSSKDIDFDKGSFDRRLNIIKIHLGETNNLLERKYKGEIN